MTLTLTMLRCPDAVAPQTRTVEGGEFSIGRGPENDWALPDPERFLSKRHCTIAYRSGGWQIADSSTNGTFLNGEAEPIGRGRPRGLANGDRLRLGPYEIEVRLAETAPRQRASRADPFALDPFGGASPHPNPPPPAGEGARYRAQFDPPPFTGEGRVGAGRAEPGHDRDPFAEGLAGPAIRLPADYDPLAPEPEAPFAGPVQSDHSPHLEDAFAAPVARAVLPDDWDRDLDPHPAPPRAAEPVAPAVPDPPPPPPAPVPPAAPTEDLFAAFLRGTRLRGVRPADPAATMEMLGAVFRTFVSGLRQAMIARSAVKNELRIEATLIRSRGNNPLKFSADDDDALTALLGAGRRTEMGAVEAVGEALRDLRLHEIATVAAMQAAARALVSEFDPAKLRLAAERGGLEFVPMQKKAHAWDAFEAHHARVVRALADNFDSVFGKAFARAYERALSDAAARDREP